MAYIGKSPTGTGVRQRYYFTATGGETSLSGTDDNGLTLSYSDGAYVDVLLNGIELVAGTDYNTSTANTIAGLAALAASDVVTVTVYDIFTVADTVSAKDGGTFSGNVVFNGNTTGLDLNGTEMVLDADGDSKIEASTDDTVNIISGGTTGLTVDSSGRILTPARPAFNVRPSAVISYTSAGWKNPTFATEEFDIGGNFASGYFTCPVDGIYQFNVHVRFDTASSQIALALSDVVGVASPLTGNSTTLYTQSYVSFGSASTTLDSLHTSLTAQLDANTKVAIWIYANDNSWSVSTVSNFSGFLVG